MFTRVIVYMLKLVLIGILGLAAAATKHQFTIRSSKDDNILYTSWEGLTLELFPPFYKNTLCRQQQQFYVDP